MWDKFIYYSEGNTTIQPYQIAEKELDDELGYAKPDRDFLGQIPSWFIAVDEPSCKVMIAKGGDCTIVYRRRT